MKPMVCYVPFDWSNQTISNKLWQDSLGRR